MTNKSQAPQSRCGCLVMFFVCGFIVAALAGVIDTCATPMKPGDPISTALVWVFLLGFFYVLINTEFKRMKFGLNEARAFARVNTSVNTPAFFH